MRQQTVAFHHFGCKVNFAEASALSRQFAGRGFRLADFHDKADIYVISSCAVTAAAEKKCRAAIRQAHALNPDARIAVIGCFPELKPGEVSSLEGVDIVLGHQGKFRLLEAIEKKHPSPVPSQFASLRSQGEWRKSPSGDLGIHKGSGFIPSHSVGDRTRSFLKIQDGCDYHCAYCTIPLARGRSRSDTIDHVVAEAKQIAAEGVKEIVLTGVNIGDFGKNNGETLSGLLTALEKEITVPRIRISSIEPDLLHNEIIELVATSQKLLPHFHIPLQSGSEMILRAMKRKYDLSLYSKRIEKIRNHIPDACIAADVIAGFPGETPGAFEESKAYLEELPLSYMHVFSYSRRENTLAASAGVAVIKNEKHLRSEILHQLSDEKKHTFYLRNKGREARVLFESDNREGMMHGFTENYIRVKTPYDPTLVNEILTVKLEELDEDMCYLVNKH